MEKKPAGVEDLLNAIQETVDTIQNKKGPIKITPELLADIETLKKAVSDLKKNTRELLDILEVNVRDVQKEILESPKLKTNEKQLIKHTDDLKKRMLAIKIAIAQASKSDNKLENIENQVVDKKQLKQRRKLFKSIGGNKKWIPL